MEKKSLSHYMRSLHRDIGFFLIGLVVIYSISGITLIYRRTDFLKQEKIHEEKLSPNMEISEVGKALHIRDAQILETEGDVIHFQTGTYNKNTGIAKYSTRELPKWINKFNGLHKTSTDNAQHWFTTIFGVLLLFLAISSFWMFKSKSKMFRRGLYFAGVGIVAAILLLVI